MINNRINYLGLLKLKQFKLFNLFLYMASLTKEDLELIKTAKKLVSCNEVVRGGIIKEVGCALLTKKGKIFTGANMHLPCDLGFCAEASAISNMISHSDETEIKTIVSVKDKVRSPCGRCRELIHLINKKNLENTFVIISEKEKIKLKELLPHDWIKG